MNGDQTATTTATTDGHGSTRMELQRQLRVSRKGAKAAKNCQELQLQERETATAKAHPQIARITQIS
jgi:hypothetical protein